MHSTAARPWTPLVWFACLAVGIYATAVAIVDALPRLDVHASTMAAALTIDLVIVVPLAFYVLVVRRMRLPIVTVVPVLVASALAASLVIPSDQHHTLRVLEALAIPAEMSLLGWIGWHAVRALRDARRDLAADPLEQLRSAAFALIRNDRAAAIVATEIGVFWYAIGSWRTRPHVPAGATAISHHRRSGHAGMAFAFIIAMSVEAIAVHLLLLNWSAAAAWVFTIGTAYGALWLVADYRATVLRPILISDDCVLIRAGFRCTISIPRARMTGVGRTKPEPGKESVNLTFLGTPTRWITLSEPMIAEGPYGFRRRVRSIGIEPDAPEEFDRILECQQA